MAGKSRTVTRNAGFYVEGWSAFVKELKAAGEGVDQELRERFKGVAEEVAAEARQAAEGRHPVARHPRARPSQRQHWADLVGTIRAGATARTPHVAVGSARVPWALGQEFGGGRRATTRQFPPWRGNGEGAGYFLWPTIRENREEMLEAADAAVSEVLRKAYPEGLPG